MPKKKEKVKEKEKNVKDSGKAKDNKRKPKDDKTNSEVVVRARLADANFKHLRLCLQQILNKINSLILPLIKNCRSDKVRSN